MACLSSQTEYLEGYISVCVYLLVDTMLLLPANSVLTVGALYFIDGENSHKLRGQMFERVDVIRPVVRHLQHS